VKGPLDLSRDLLAADVSHEFVRLPRRITAAEELPSVLGVRAEACVVVHVFETDTRPAAVALPAGYAVSPSAIARALRANELVAAAPMVTNALTDFTAGLVAPLGLPEDIQLLVDASLGVEPVLYTATGDGGTALKIRSRDLLRHVGARVDSFAAPHLVPVPGLRLPAGRPHGGIAAVEEAAPAV
jgi:prolyl-tRNA editing enzyme YbaK/EbsC (Cys-tRNA(Pro) deacylase)